MIKVKQYRNYLAKTIQRVTKGTYTISNLKKCPPNPFIDKKSSLLLDQVLHDSLTMTSSRNLLFTYQSCKSVNECKIEGDFCEVGVWRGGHLIAATLGFGGANNRKVWGIDTFSGMTDPLNSEYNFNTGKKAVERKIELESGAGWEPASESEVESNLISFGVNKKQFKLISVNMASDLEINPYLLPSLISVLRVDVDWREPTWNSLNYLYEKVSKGGIVILDDYGSWSGAKEAVDEFRLRNKIMSPLLQIDSGSFFWVKN